MDFEIFFTNEVPKMLKKLDATAQPEWGGMTAPEMLDHLRRGVDLSLRTDLEVKITIPEDHIASYQNFLKTDKLFKKGAEMPKEYSLIKEYEGDFESLKVNLLKSLVNMQVYFEKCPEHKATHANFGELDTELWMYLHKKHILHHFTQFGITS